MQGLSSMKKLSGFVRMCLRKRGDIYFALCACTAGFAGSCNRTMARALEDFTRRGLQQESAVSCKSKKCRWNRPRSVSVHPLPISEVRLERQRCGVKKKEVVDQRQILINCQQVKGLLNLLEFNSSAKTWKPLTDMPEQKTERSC